MKTTLHKFLALACSSLLAIPSASAATIALNSTKESHIRQAQATTNQGQTRLIFGAQGPTANTEFRAMMQFSLADLVTATGGAPITVTSVSLDSGDAFSWSGNQSSNSFSVRAWGVNDFNVANNTWNDPQGSAGSDIAGGSLGLNLSTETFSSSTPQGDFIFTSTASFVSHIQTAYDNYTPGDNLNFILLTNNPNINTIPRTDAGSVQGIGTADLNVAYTVVPEPGSLALLGLGGLLVASRRRRD